MTAPPDFLLFDAFPLGVSVVYERRITYANAALLRLLGRTREEMIGAPDTLVLEPSEVAKIPPEAAAPGSLVSKELKVVHKDGRVLHVDCQVAEQNGQYICILRDISARVEQRKILQQLAELGASLQSERTEESVLRRAFQGLDALPLSYSYVEPRGDGLEILRYDSDSTFPERLREFGRSPQSVARGRWSDIYRRAWDESAVYSERYTDLLGFFEDTLREAVERTLVDANIKKVIVVRVDLGTGPRGLLTFASSWLTVEEVPSLRLFAAQMSSSLTNAHLYSEARQRAAEFELLASFGQSLVGKLELAQVLDIGAESLARIVDTPSAYLMLPDEAATYLEVKAVAGEHQWMLGGRVTIQSPEDSLASVAFRSGQSLVVEDGESDPRTNVQIRELTGGKSYLTIPMVVRGRSIGVAVLVESRRRRLYTPAEVDRATLIGNQLALGIESARLYDDLRRSYAELARAHEQLVRQERLAALGELSAVVAHEVRNPLGAIFNSIASLKRIVVDQGPSLELLEIMSEEADRLSRIVDDLLDFARPAKPRFQFTDLASLVEDAVMQAVGRAEQPVQVQWHLAARVPHVPVDVDMMRQALANLAVNAVQAMPQGGTLSVTLGTRYAETDSLQLELNDTGPGITDEVRARIFEPFFTTKAKGTGLGLALVKRIVEAHDGQLFVESQLGEGTTFRMLLPLTLAS